MDGTIVDNMGVHNECWLELLARHGVHMEEKAFYDQTAGMTNPKIFRLIFGEKLSDQEIETLSLEKENIYRERYAPRVAPVEGLVELMSKARESGIKLGLATSAPPENIEFILGRTGLNFDAIVGGQEVTHSKPDPEIYLTCAKKLGAEPAECVVFEDAPIGIQSGVNAKMRVIVVTTVLDADEALAIPGVSSAVSNFVEALPLVF